MKIRQPIVLGALVLAGCVAGRVGRLDAEGGVVGRDGSILGMDGAVGPDGSSPLDGASADGSILEGDGAVSRRDGALGDGSVRVDGSLPLFEVRCDDGLDNDGDGATDCADDDCADAPCDAAGGRCTGGVCGGCRGEPSETACGDGVDDDCDGRIDCADPDCAGNVCGPGGVTCSGGACPCPSGFVERICSDGMDDDCDGLIDCADPDCEGRSCSGTGMLCSSRSCTCMESIEFCNDQDENCDGIIDNSCPRGLGLCCPSPLGGYGAGSGTAFSAPCPSGSVLVGLAGRASTRIDRIQPVCAPLVLETDRDARPEFAYTVRRGAIAPGTAHGGTGGTAFDERCPGDDVVIGVRGTRDDFGGVRSIGLECGRFTIARVGFSIRIMLAPSSSTPLRGGGGTESFAAGCTASGAVTDTSGRAGTTVSSLSFTCRQVQLQTF